MRFHIGVSFRWKTIKKFLIPILIGALAYFGFSGIFDNFNIPLGYLNVNAQEFYETTDEANEDNNIVIDDEEYESQSLQVIDHKPLFNKIYWFDDNSTEIGILSSIYILLFLYCITMVLFKIATLLKNKRW